ncbi:Iron-sulfur assembly protein 2 [Vanrija pseudolonga]|uniref:Iron-sulfur assembly protein 2 n=1 Tax=Vanrija pseudolonga TaxID=143232 RepID=A0AAF0Y8Y9_9TREE|nr:Iron-sulfur assembly protein 2 [Vanrija pseudolonga]
MTTARLSSLVPAVRGIAASHACSSRVLLRTAAPRIPPAHARRYASTAASMSSAAPNLPPIPANPTVRVLPPSLQKVKDEGFFDDDVKLIPATDAKIVLTPEAIRQLALLASREPPDSKLALRVGVDSGGCHGYQYTMDLTEDRGVDDYVFQADGVTALPVLVDLMSLGLLKGATLHYATELIGSSFRLQDNPQAKEGGNCGCGVSWEAKEDVQV